MRWLLVDVFSQRLQVFQGDRPEISFTVSTGKNGVGEQNDTGKTPRGWHQVRAVIGRGQQENTVFVARRPTGERYNQALSERFPGRDWVLSRILWLSGLESGKNRLGKVDTMRRYIYIHGTPATEPMGVPESHGCIRMRNADVMQLADLIDPGVPVLIKG